MVTCAVTERNINWFTALSHMPVWRQFHKPLHYMQLMLTELAPVIIHQVTSHNNVSVHITFTSWNASNYTLLLYTQCHLKNQKMHTVHNIILMSSGLHGNTFSREVPWMNPDLGNVCFLTARQHILGFSAVQWRNELKHNHILLYQTRNKYLATISHCWRSPCAHYTYKHK